MSAVNSMLIFVASTLLTFYIGAVLLRLILAVVRADFYNPISQTIVMITDPPLRPLRRLLPSVGRIDTAGVVLAVALAILKTTIIVALAGFPATPAVIVHLSMKDLAETLVYIYIISLIGEVIMSWVAAGGGGHNSLGSLLAAINRPLIGPVRRFIPPIGMIDLSPLFVLIGLNALLILIRAL